MKSILSLILCLFFCGVSAQTDSLSTDVPSIIIKNIEGESVDVSTYAHNGHLTILCFFATWCKPCYAEFKNFSELLEDWSDAYDVELVGISTDDARNTAKVKSTAMGMGWDFDILLDPNGAVQRAMNVVSPPMTMLVDRNGAIVYSHMGYLEGDEYILEDHIKELVD
jgi:cytochrome c biogenesis protein CcmG/thiol:disulfide interchange protein DsbE